MEMEARWKDCCHGRMAKTADAKKWDSVFARVGIGDTLARPAS